MNNFSVEELNDLYYALGTAANHTQFGTEMKQRLEKLQDKVWDMLVANYKEDEGPEYDGAGFRHEDNIMREEL